MAELKYGAYYSRKTKENLENIAGFLRKVKVLTLDYDGAERFGKIKAELRRSGRVIQDFDLLIASITLRHAGILVTNNVEHFKLVGWVERSETHAGIGQALCVA